MSNTDESTPTAVDPSAEPETIRPSATGVIITDEKVPDSSAEES